MRIAALMIYFPPNLVAHIHEEGALGIIVEESIGLKLRRDARYRQQANCP